MDQSSSNRAGRARPPRLEKLLAIPPGGRKKTRRSSEYGVRLRENSALNSNMGYSSARFVAFFEQARRMSGPTGFNLLQLLERRADHGERIP
jgi:ribosomal protein S4